MTTSVTEKPLEKIIAGLIKRYSLIRVEMLMTESVIRAKAFPSAHHPEVTRRRESGMAALAKQYGGSVPLFEATNVTNSAVSPAIADVKAETFSDALDKLEQALKALK